MLSFKCQKRTFKQKTKLLRKGVIGMEADAVKGKIAFRVKLKSGTEISFLDCGYDPFIDDVNQMAKKLGLKNPDYDQVLSFHNELDQISFPGETKNKYKPLVFITRSGMPIIFESLVRGGYEWKLCEEYKQQQQWFGTWFFGFTEGNK